MRKIRRIKKVAEVFSITGKYLRLSRKIEDDFNDLKSRWSRDILNHFKINIQIEGKPFNQNEPCLLIGNHINYLDIPILLYSCPQISFVSKKEVKSWPVIGSAATKMEAIFVERSNAISRINAKSEIANTLLENKQKLVLFPSGTTSIDNSKQWKKGAFEIAEQHNIKVQPFRIRYQPLREAAYIDDDNLLMHMFQLFKFDTINVSIEFHEPVLITDSIADCNRWKSWCENRN